MRLPEQRCVALMTDLRQNFFHLLRWSWTCLQELFEHQYMAYCSSSIDDSW